jgi:hypothetical protein
MTGAKNGKLRAAALTLGPLYGPKELRILLDARKEVMLGLATSDEERAIVEASTWEERPETTQLVNRLMLRVESNEDREILRRAEGYRLLLPSAPWRPPPDPELEGLIRTQVERRAQAEAVAELSQRTLVDVIVARLKARTPSDVQRLEAEEKRAQAERQHALTTADHEASRLADLINQRANRERWPVTEHAQQGKS